MITINLVCVGNIKEKFFNDAIQEYSKRLSKFCKLKIKEVNEYKLKNEKITESVIENIKHYESKLIEKHLSGHVVLLDVVGQSLTSEELANKIIKTSLTFSDITFIIGGSYGVSEELKKKVNFSLSFSSFTFPHQLMRVVFLEQLYRAFTINNNITYHK